MTTRYEGVSIRAIQPIANCVRGELLQSIKCCPISRSAWGAFRNCLSQLTTATLLHCSITLTITYAPTILATPAYHPPATPSRLPSNSRTPHVEHTTALTTAFAIACRLHRLRYLCALPFATLLLRVTFAIRPFLFFRS